MLWKLRGRATPLFRSFRSTNRSSTLLARSGDGLLRAPLFLVPPFVLQPPAYFLPVPFTNTHNRTALPTNDGTPTTMRWLRVADRGWEGCFSETRFYRERPTFLGRGRRAIHRKSKQPSRELLSSLKTIPNDADGGCNGARNPHVERDQPASTIPPESSREISSSASHPQYSLNRP